MSADTSLDQRVSAAVGGDRQAAQEVLTAMLPRVRNLVRYLVRGDQDVDDITQEAMLAMLRGLGSYRAEGTLNAWADRVTARATFAYLKRAHRDRDRRRRLPTEAPDLRAVPHPGERASQYTRRREVVALLDQLPTDQRHALVLHHVMGMTVPEIARDLSLSPETIRSRLRIGRKKLRKARAASEARE